MHGRSRNEAGKKFKKAGGGGADGTATPLGIFNDERRN